MKVYNFRCYRYLYAASISDTLHTTSGDGSDLWREIDYDAEFSGYCILSVCESQPNLVSIGNLKGSLKLLSLSDAGWCQ